LEFLKAAFLQLKEFQNAILGTKEIKTT